VASELERFLYRLANDPNLLTQYQADPDAVLAGADLTNSEKDLVRSGDATKIMSALRQGGVTGVVVVVVPPASAL
jgi:Aromatic-ring-opening dioxygenase LigAB, LigA subunit